MTDRVYLKSDDLILASALCEPKQDKIISMVIETLNQVNKDYLNYILKGIATEYRNGLYYLGFSFRKSVKEK